jgi:hypothetical protein
MCQFREKGIMPLSDYDISNTSASSHGCQCKFYAQCTCTLI